MFKQAPAEDKGELALLLRDIEKFLRRTGMPDTKFGRLAVRDPRLVTDLRNGREPRRRMVIRVEHFMNTYGGEARNDHNVR